MSNLPEAVRAAERIVNGWYSVQSFTCQQDRAEQTKARIAEIAAIISSEFAPLVEERDWLMVGNTELRFDRDQLQAKLDAVVGAVSKLRAALKPWTGGDDGK